RAQQKSAQSAKDLKDQTAHKTPEPLGLSGALSSGSCNGLFSLGNSLQGSISTYKRSAFVPYLTLRTSSITLASHFPQLGQTHKSGPPGGSTAHFTTFQE